MKKIFIVLLAMAIPLQSFAQEKSVLQGVIEEMTKKYLEEAAKSMATKQLEEYASQKLGMELSGKLGTAFAFVSLVDGVLQYDKANSETQRYQALSQTVASGISIVAPPVGALVSLGVMAQGMMGALVSKTYAIKLAQLVKDISDLELQSSESRVKQAESEKTRFTTLVARSVAIETLIRENSKLLEQQCSPEKNSVEEINKCFQSSLLQRSLLKMYVNTMTKIAGFNGRFINTIAGLNQTEIDKINATLKTGVDHIAKIETSILETIRYFAEISVLTVRHEVEERYRYMTCERLLLSNAKKILDLRFRIAQNPSSAEMLDFVIEEYQIDLKSLTEESCKDSFQFFDTSVRDVIQNLLPNPAVQN